MFVRVAKLPAVIVLVSVLTGCTDGMAGLSYNTIQMPGTPGLDGEWDTDDDVAGNFYGLAKFDNLIGPSVAVLEVNGRFQEAFSETGLIGAVATGAGIATSGYGHDYEGDSVTVNASADGADAHAGALAGAKSLSFSDADAKSVSITKQSQKQGQQQGQKQGQAQGQKQGQIQGQKQALINKPKKPHHGPRG